MAYDSLDNATKGNYDNLKEALRERLVPGEHNLLRRQAFMALTRNYGEAPSSFELRLMREVELAYAEFPVAARNALMKEQFIRGIGDADIQLHLLTQNPANLRAAVQLAEQFEQVKRVSGTAVVVRGVSQPKSQSEVNPAHSGDVQSKSELQGLRDEVVNLTKAIGRLLQVKGEEDRRKPEYKGKKQGQYFDGKCHNCGIHGHKAVDCRRDPQWTCGLQ